jgi:uncharacterized iron-regulated membrane protein
MMSVTGVLLMYEHRIIEAVDSELTGESPAAGAERSLENLARAALEQASAGDSVSLEIAADPEKAAQVRVGRERVFYLDAQSGAFLGDGAQKIRHFFSTVTAIHRWFGATGEHRGLARAITGAANLLFFFLVLSGLYLWIPKRWSLRQVRNIAWFRRGLSAKARDFNWHHTLGLWTALPLLIIVASGVVMSYRWANDLVYRIAGDEPPPPRERSRGPRAGGEGSGGDEAETAPVELAGLDEAFAIAERQVPDWESISLRLPPSPEGPVDFRISWGLRGRPDQRGELAVDRRSGEVLSWKTSKDETPGRRARSWLRWLHTGEAGGFAGETLAGVSSAAAAVLVWTGLFLSWRRFFPRRRNRRSRASEPKDSNDSDDTSFERAQDLER